MINSTLCYITRGSDVLMLHRVKKKNDINKDKWIGIGGKFEPEESEGGNRPDVNLLALPRNRYLPQRCLRRGIYVPVYGRRL